MKLTPIVFLALALLLVINLNVCPVESRRRGHHRRGEGHHPPGEGHHHDRDYDHDGDGEHHRHRRHKHRQHHDHHVSFYVFGDSFADNGNLPHWDDTWPALSRQWYYPYGANGRFSNKMVESDFIANMVGLNEAPPARALGSRPGSRKGMNFAVGGSGVYKVPEEKPTLRMQIDSFIELVEDGRIDYFQGKSVALVAVSGNDYDRVGVDTSAFGGITAYADNVTSEIAANVDRLQVLGVQKVIVNNLYPLGCAPSQSRPSNYTSCDEQANQAAFQHNRYLSDKLADMDGVLILDLSAAFKQILNQADEVAQDFAHILRPCCESFEPSGYCGLSTRENSANVTINRFKVCNDAESYFYWDDMHPTQAGWAAVMGQLESTIKEFLEIDY